MCKVMVQLGTEHSLIFPNEARGLAGINKIILFIWKLKPSLQNLHKVANEGRKIQLKNINNSTT